MSDEDIPKDPADFVELFDEDTADELRNNPVAATGAGLRLAQKRENQRLWLLHAAALGYDVEYNEDLNALVAKLPEEDDD